MKKVDPKAFMILEAIPFLKYGPWEQGGGVRESQVTEAVEALVHQASGSSLEEPNLIANKKCRPPQLGILQFFNELRRRSIDEGA